LASDQVALSSQALSNDTLINVWSGGWEWCEKETSGSTIVRNNVTCSAEYGTGGPWFGKMHVRDDSWTKTMAKAAAAGFRTLLSSPFYLNAENYGSNFDEVWPYCKSNQAGRPDGGAQHAAWIQFMPCPRRLPLTTSCACGRGTQITRSSRLRSMQSSWVKTAAWSY
jgi:hypothetical protein